MCQTSRQAAVSDSRFCVSQVNPLPSPETQRHVAPVDCARHWPGAFNKLHDTHFFAMAYCTVAVPNAAVVLPFPLPVKTMIYRVHPGPGPHEHRLFLSLAVTLLVAFITHWEIPGLRPGWRQRSCRFYGGCHRPSARGRAHDISGCFKFLWIFGREGAGRIAVRVPPGLMQLTRRRC